MKLSGIDFPEPLLIALRDAKLVVFAGAGVSMGEPARLPSFKDLAAAIAKGTGIALENHESEDRFLGRLKHQRVNVHSLAAQALSRDDPQPTELHRDLLRLCSDAGQVRIVTTNFDSLFEQAAECMFDSKPEVFRAPALPLGREFNGIVHIHGALDRPGGIVLTDADFGCAYLTEGWARRFLVELFRQFTVLFVGYGHNDTVMNYLARALPISEAGRRFALAGEHDADLQRWRFLGIEPITYPQSSEDDYSALHKGVRRLAEVFGRGILDWQREITELAQKNPPMLGEEEAGLIEEMLKDETKTRFFTAAASSPEWLDWLDKRKHLDALFGSGALSERDVILVWWLAERFAFRYADKLFLLIARHDTRLHPFFWQVLGRKIGLGEQDPLDKEVLSRWISLLLATAPADVDNHVRLWMGKRCVKHGMLNSLLQVFDAMAGSRLLLKQGFSWEDADNDGPSAPVEVDSPPINEQYALDVLWQNDLKPNLAQVAEPLLGVVIRRLEEQHLTLCVWQGANRNWDSTNWQRLTIESSGDSEALDVLIDAARDCLEWLAANQVDATAHRCVQLAGSEIPLLRRLAVHTLSTRAELTADDKIDWLLKHIGLHDLPVHHETFRAVKLAYPGASLERRKAVIDAVRAYRWPDEEDPDKEQRTAYSHFEWLHWLHEAAPDCALTKQALDGVQARYPEFTPSEHPDLTHWTGSFQQFTPRSPWTPEELLAKPAADWLQELLSFQPSKEPFGPDRHGLVDAVQEAAKQKFDWGLDLADALAKAGEWDADLWSGLIRAWSGMDLDEDRHRQVLNRLGRVELYPQRAREIAAVLRALIKNQGTPYASKLLPQANAIAVALWDSLDRGERPSGDFNWLTQAINHPAGVLAEFWLGSLAIWRRQQEPLPKTMNDEYRTALSGIVQDDTLAGRLGRSFLASQFAFLLAVDEAWTKENLLPFFYADCGADDFQATWDGFLTWGRLNPNVAEHLNDAFLKAVQRVDTDLAGRRDNFVKYYTTMLGYFAPDPLGTWVPELLCHSGKEVRRLFAFEIGRHLRGMDEARRQEWWRRWLKRYWENRLQGVPIPLESDEVGRMLGWLPDLTAVFPEAIDLAIRMLDLLPTEALDRGHGVIDRLSRSDSLVKNRPQEIAKLLICLSRFDSPQSWYGGRELVDQLLQSELSPELEHGLEEIKAKRGL